MLMLNEAELEALVPAAFTRENEMMSNRYAHLETMAVIRRMSAAGYVPVEAKQDCPTARNPAYVTHQIVLRHADHAGASLLDPEVPQITVVNSHNGRTKMRMYGGLFRVICTNGLVVGDPSFFHEIRHTGEDAFVEAAGFAEDMTGEMVRLKDSIERWKKIPVTSRAARELAERAAVLRYGDSAANYPVASLLAARREEDDAGDLWAVFNRLQENTIKGGIHGQSKTSRQVTSKAMSAIQPTIAYNRALWDLAAELA